MTGFRCRHLRHHCTDHSCYLQQLPTWDDIVDCFPRNIWPTDVDGMVEIGGRVLMLEEKMPGVSPPGGQRHALQVLSRGPHSTDVVFFRPVALGSTQMQVLHYPNPQGFQPMERSQLLERIAKWAFDADAGRETIWDQR